MKKLRFLSALFVATGLTALSPAKALAEAMPTLVLGENSSITISAIDNTDFSAHDGYNLYSFVAPETGLISVAASGDGDSYGALFSTGMEQLAYNDDSNGNGDFKFLHNVAGGETYYIGLRSYNINETLSDYTITIQYETSVVVETKMSCAGYNIGLPGYVYATYAGTEDVVSEAVPFGTEIDLHAAEEISVLTFDHWENSDGSVLEETTIAASPSDFNRPYFAVYNAPEGKCFVALNGPESCTCDGYPFIVKTIDSPEEVTIDYVVNEDQEFDYVEYAIINSEDEYEIFGLEGVVNDPVHRTLTFTVPADCVEITLYFQPKPYLEFYYNDDSYNALVNELTECEDGTYSGTIYVEASAYEDLHIDYIATSFGWDDYSYSKETIGDDDKLVLTLLAEGGPVAVFNLTVVKGHFIWLYCDPVRCTMSIGEEGDYIKIHESSDHDTMQIFVPEGGECQVTAVSTDSGEYKFVEWNNMDGEVENVTVQTLTLDSSSLSSWEAVFSSENWVKVWLGTYPSVYAWLTDSEGNKIYDSEGHTEFDSDGNPVDDEEYVYGLLVAKGSDITLHCEESIGALTFGKWINTKTDEVCESATVTVTDDVEFVAMYQRTVTTTNGWMTYCDGSGNYTVEGGKAYTAHYQEGVGEEPACVVLTSIDGVIAWNEGILISSETSATIAYTYYGADNVEGNELYGNYNEDPENIVDTPIDGKTMYGLYNQDPAQIGFKRYTGETLPPHKAVLVPGLTSEDIPFEAPLRIVIDNEEVGIIQVAAGQDPFEAIFDLMGRRQNNVAAKGLVVKDGKVVLKR